MKQKTAHNRQDYEHGFFHIGTSLGLDTATGLDRAAMFMLYNQSALGTYPYGAAYVGDVKISLFAGAEKLLKQGVENGFLRKDLDIEQTAMSLNMFCFSAFSNIHTMSKLLGKDLSIQAELEKRADHIYEVLVKYILA